MKKSEVPKGILKIYKMICACGRPECVWEQVHYILVRASTTLTTPPNPARNLEDNEWLAAYLCSHVYMTEHGSSVEWAWLTKEGKDALTFLEIHGHEWFEDLED